MKYFRFNLGDYLLDAMDLTWHQDCAYMRLLRICYATERPLPLEHARIYTLAHAHTSAHHKAINYVLTRFFERKADGYHQHRIDEEINQYRTKAKKLSDNSNTRWGNVPKNEASNGHDLLKNSAPTIGWRSADDRLAIGPYQNVTGEGESQRGEKSALDASNPNAIGYASRNANHYQEPITNKLSSRAARAHDGVSEGARVTLAARRLGLQAANPSDPRLLQLLAEGATAAEFDVVVAQAVAAGKGWAWVLATVAGRRKDALNGLKRSYGPQQLGTWYQGVGDKR